MTFELKRVMDATGRARKAVRHLWLLLLLLLVRWQAAVGSAAREATKNQQAKYPLLPLLGKRKLDPQMGW